MICKAYWSTFPNPLKGATFVCLNTGKTGTKNRYHKESETHMSTMLMQEI